MSRVEIDADQRHIVIDHDGELAPLVAAARDLWDHTNTPPKPPGPATGFTTAQRWSPTAPATSMGAMYGGEVQPARCQEAG